MNLETRGWIATAILSPLCFIALSWTLVIFHSNRRKWQSKDLIISTLLTEGIIKLVATFSYALVTLLKPIEYFETYCGCVKWLITSVDVLQAATIGTLIFTRLLAVRFPTKFRATVKRTHLYYHFITLGILSSCIGIASILSERVTDDFAGEKGPEDRKYCTFLPYELNPKYAFLSISLHSVVDFVTIIALFWTVRVICDKKRHPVADSSNASNSSTIIGRNASNQRHALMTSASDLSRLSESSLRGRHSHAELNGTHETNFGSYLCSSNAKLNLGRIFDNQRYGNDNYYGDISSGKSSTDTLKSSRLAQNYHQLMCSGQKCGQSSNYDEICSPTPVNRWASESSYLSTSTSSTNSRAPCLSKKPARESNLGIGTTLAIFLLCFSFNHLPFLVVTLLGTFVPSLVASLPLNAYLLWAGLLQECLLPMLLAALDRDFKIWLRQLYTRQHRTPLAKHQGLDGKFRVFNTPLQPMQPILMHNEPIKFPITNGSLFTSVDGRLPIIHNYRRGLGQRSTGSGLMASHCVSMGLPAAMRRVEFNARIQDRDRDEDKMQRPGYRHPGPCTDGIDRMNGQDRFRQSIRSRNGHLPDFRLANLDFEPFGSNTLQLSEYDGSTGSRSEPIYATLSSRSCCSATTAANDDFEFYQNDVHATVTDAINNSMFQSGFVKDCDEVTDKDIFPVIGNRNYILAHDIGRIEDSGSEECTQEVLEASSEIDPPAKHNLSELFATCSESESESRGRNKQSSENGNLSNEEIVSIIEKCFMDIHEQYSAEPEPTEQKVESLHEPKVESLVLESFNNLKHLHEMRLLHENKCLPSTSSKGNVQCTNLLLEDPNPNTLSARESFQETSSNKDDHCSPYDTFESETHDNSNRRLYKKTPLSRRYLEPLSTKRLNTPPTSRRLMKPRRLEKTPPICRRSVSQPYVTEISSELSLSGPSSGPSSGLDWNKMSPVLSVDSLSAALNNADLSYLDNGEVWTHSREAGGSEPDLKKIFVSEFI